MIEKREVTEIKQRAQALLDEKNHRVQDARRVVNDADSHADRIMQEMERALENGDRDKYVSAKEESIRAQALREINEVKLQKAMAVSDEERREARDVDEELIRTIQELDGQNRAAVTEQLIRIRAEALDVLLEIGELAKLRNKLYFSFGIYQAYFPGVGPTDTIRTDDITLAITRCIDDLEAYKETN